MKVKKDILNKISSSLTSSTNSRRLKTANRSNIYLYQNTVTKKFGVKHRGKRRISCRASRHCSSNDRLRTTA